MLPETLTDDLYGHIYPTFKGFLEDQISLNQATQHIALRVLQRDGDPDLLWTFILECAQRCPDYQDKLIDVLVQLSHLPDAKTPEGVVMDIDGATIWKDLPLLGRQLRYLWNFGSATDVEGPSKNLQTLATERESFLALNQFVAAAVATEEKAFSSWSSFAIGTFREALETHDKRVNNWEVFGVWVMAASYWVENAGSVLFELEEAYETTVQGIPIPCESRWQFWYQRFEYLAAQERLPADAAAAARTAAVIMRQIEDGEMA
jgi:hypothetical protein